MSRNGVPMHNKLESNIDNTLMKGKNFTFTLRSAPTCHMHSCRAKNKKSRAFLGERKNVDQFEGRKINKAVSHIAFPVSTVYIGT